MRSISVILALTAATSAMPLATHPILPFRPARRAPQLVDDVNDITSAVTEITDPITNALPVDVDASVAPDLLPSLRRSRRGLDVDLGGVAVRRGIDVDLGGLQVRAPQLVDDVNDITSKVTDITDPITNALPVDVDASVAPDLLPSLRRSRRGLDVDLGGVAVRRGIDVDLGGLQVRAPQLVDDVNDITSKVTDITDPITDALPVDVDASVAPDLLPSLVGREAERARRGLDVDLGGVAVRRGLDVDLGGVAVRRGLDVDLGGVAV